jgi:hypothetical protein
MQKIIPTQEFVHKFPSKAKSIGEDLETGLSLTYRTFRYYITNGYMPKPIIINKKSFYNDTTEMYLRLFIIRYLTNVSRKKPSVIVSILKAVHNETELKYLHTFIGNEEFLLLIAQGTSFQKAIEDCHSTNERVAGGLAGFNNLFHLTLNAELSWCNSQLKLVTEDEDYLHSPDTLLGEIESNLRVLKKMGAAINKSQQLLSKAKIKTVKTKKQADAAAFFK